MEIDRGNSEAPPWFTGWITLIPIIFFGTLFLYYGLKYKKEHQKTIQDEGQPELFRVMPW